MLTAFYIGDHTGDTLIVRWTCKAIRFVQKGPLGIVTHCEAIHAQHDDGTVTIASASYRDGGVRTKVTALTPGNWMIVDVPEWDVVASIAWFKAHDGEPYDWRGAVATVLPGHKRDGEWFCNEALGASIGFLYPETFGPHQFAAIALTLGKDVTTEFFKET